jgi:molybdopterin molybdotransferase
MIGAPAPFDALVAFSALGQRQRLLLSAIIRRKPSTRSDRASCENAASFGCKFCNIFGRQVDMVSTQRLPASLTPLDVALAALLQRLEAVRPAELPLADALGCVMADMPSLQPLPAHDVAAVDGWALHSRDLVGASSYSPIVLSAPPVWVEAGEAMPHKSDCVVDRDAVEQVGSLAQALAEAIPGQGVRRAGCDIAGGTSAFATGRIVGPRNLLMAQSAGLVVLNVRRPRVRIVNVSAVGKAVTAHLILGCAQAEGAAIAFAEAAGRDAASIASAIGTDACDLLVTIGGTGVGRTDATISALSRCGEIIAHGLALQPGRTGAVGRVGAVPVVALPGAPDQALAAWWTLALAALDRLAGRGPRLKQTLPLSRKIASQVGLAEIVLLARTDEGWSPLAAGDLSLAAISRADAWMAVPGNSEGFAARTSVDAYILRE